MKIIIAGSSGFIGSHLISFFEKQGQDLVLLTRNPDKPRTHYWNPELNQVDPAILEGADVVINLAGENIFGRWSDKKKEKIRESRLVAAEFLCNTLLTLKVPPKLYIGASAIGYYGDRPNEVLTESSAPGDDFLAEVCRAWESVPDSLAQKNIRVVLSRFGIVLASEGGALKYIQKAFSTGMGGILGSGKQMMSWIAIDDLCSAMQHVIEHTEICGPVNFVAPQALSNLEFTQTVGKLLNRKPLLPIPKFALNLLFGEGGQVLLSSTHAYPQRLLDSGYLFQYPELEGALKKYLLVNTRSVSE